MKRSWLIQRLEEPRVRDNPFSFGGGLKNGGLSDEAMDLLRGVFSFDYMGAAEFEFGEVPKALQKIAKNVDNYISFTMKISLSTIEMDWRDKREKSPLGVVSVYVICEREDVEEVQERITGWAKTRYNSDLKETTHLAGSLDPVGDWDGNIKGWLELDNGFFFFTDFDMWRNTADLFGIEVR